MILTTTTMKSPTISTGAPGKPKPAAKLKSKKSYWTKWINDYDPYEKGTIGDVEQRTLMQPVS